MKRPKYTFPQSKRGYLFWQKPMFSPLLTFLRRFTLLNWMKTLPCNIPWARWSLLLQSDALWHCLRTERIPAATTWVFGWLNGVINIADDICVYGCDVIQRKKLILIMTEIWLVYLRSAMNTILDSPREKFNSRPVLYYLWGTDLPTKEFSLIQVK